MHDILIESRDSFVGIATRLTGWTIGVLVFDSRRGLGIFLFTTASRTALGPIQPPIQWIPGALSLGIKWPWREADHSPPSSAEVKNAWSCTSNPQYVFMAWCLVKHRDNFTCITICIICNEFLIDTTYFVQCSLHAKFSPEVQFERIIDSRDIKRCCFIYRGYRGKN
jgi:hypothetical protein